MPLQGNKERCFPRRTVRDGFNLELVTGASEVHIETDGLAPQEIAK